ncbi:DNA-binding response regulator [Bacillus cereus]|nr:DNA-binding response regulator [Bacillus cereus]
MKDYLLNEGYNVLEAMDGKEALSIFEEHEVHLIILDIMLPELDGWTVCRRIRKKSNVPIIMLTARVDEDDTLLGFELGADDYVTKPYSPPILLARAKRLMESRYSSAVNVPAEDTLTSSGIHVHFPSRTVTIDGEDINLTHTEFEIVTYLMRNQGIVISREQLINKIWGYEFVGDDRTVNSHIRNLRHKLGQKAACIVTVVRAGYKFEGQV